MPAHRKNSVRRRVRTKQKNSSSVKKLFVILILLLIPLLLLLLVNRTSAVWQSGEKLTLAIGKDNGDVNLLVVDKSVNSMSVISIPGSTEVEVSRNLGRWRLKSVMKLGEKEGQSGMLLAETLTKHFKFPVYAWAEGPAEGFIDGNFPNLLKAATVGYKTNLGLGDKLNLFYYIMNIKNYKKEAINLADTRYLKKSVLHDGEEGYVVSGKIPSSLVAILAFPEFSEKSGRVQIIDKTKEKIGEKLGEVVETIGLKIVSITKESADNSDCVVSGKVSHDVELVSRLLGCRKDLNEGSGYDFVISIGSDFEKRY